MNRFKKNLGFNLGLILLGAAFLAGLAMAYLNADRRDDAVQALDRGAPLVREDDQGELQSVRALALQLAGRAGESRRALQAAGASPLAQALQGNSPEQHKAPVIMTTEEH